MSNIKYIIFLIIMIAFEACNTIKLHRNSHQTTSFPTSIGMIGVKEQGIFEKGFTTTALPVLKKGIRVSASTNYFTSKDFKNYLKIDQDNSLQIRYVDSLEEKPKFLKLALVDQVGLRAELEASYNNETTYYLQNQSKAEIITQVSVALSQSLLNEMNSADAIFLVNENYKQYQLSLIKDGKSFKKIDFSALIVFDYESSCFCWGEGKRRQVVLSDIVSKNASCPKKNIQRRKKSKRKNGLLQIVIKNERNEK